MAETVTAESSACNGHHSIASSGDSSSHTVSSSSANIDTTTPCPDLSAANTLFSNPQYTDPNCHNIPYTNPPYSNPPYHSPAYSQPPYSNPPYNPMDTNAPPLPPPPPYTYPPWPDLKDPAPPYTLPPHQQFPPYSVSGMPGAYNTSTSPGFQPSYPQQQQQVVIVGGQPSVTPVAVAYQPPVRVTSAIVLSCFVFWFFGFIFGGIAFILALKARDAASEGDVPKAIRRRNTSVSLSITGIFVSVTIIIVLRFIMYW